MRNLKWSIVIHFALMFFMLTSHAAEKGEPFVVTGEQLDHQVPNGWKVGWMETSDKGGFFVEFIPETEDINSWREGYLYIQRAPYPSAEVLKQIENAKSRPADVALFQFIRKAKEGCLGTHIPMSQRTNTFNGAHFAVGGGFCNKYGPAAPFGEGSIVAFVEGKDFIFQIQYGWRPKTLADQRLWQPWSISTDKAKEYVEALKNSTLCGGTNQPTCNIRYVR